MSIFRRQRRLFLYCLIAIGIGGIQFCATRQPTPEAMAAEEIGSPTEELPAAETPVASAFAYVGTASCAASNCHGGGKRPTGLHEDPLSSQAYSIWIHKDPHARAYSILFNKESQQIARKLSAFQPGGESSHPVPAHEMQVCLNCHTLNPPQHQLDSPQRHTLHDGVGCEACHGPASKWNELHMKPDWRALSDIEKESLGFKNLNNLTVRGQVCIDCHIGGADRDVNHDLIAAGHPRLNFELSAFHASLPKHWKHEDGEGGDPAKVEARLFRLGQPLSALAALEQLERRATLSQHASAPWPEFAEYDCYACHHQLTSPSWRQRQTRSNGKAGEYPWGSWYFSLLPGLTNETDPLTDKLSAGITQLSQEMSVPYPAEQQVIDSVKEMKTSLHGFLQEAENAAISEADIQQTIRSLTSEEQLAAGGSWEIEAQRYLAITSLFHSQAAKYRSSQALPDKLKKLKNELEQIRKAIAFSKADESVKYDSPHRYDGTRQKEVSASFQKIHQLFESP